VGRGRSKTKGFIKTKSFKGGVKGLSSRGWVKGKTRGGCGFSSLMKPKKKGKVCLVIYIAGFFLFIFCYEVIVKQN